ncbi:MAG: acyclic terpene utilization AtuA family protein [Betaproteobacteria bacterium]|nr:acyclic terpene utilization AtuA family protein [Betaproteobacteria bacterium]
MEEYRLLSTSGLLGYGFPEASLKAGLARKPHMIGVDGGSTDPGPYYLGSGECLNSRDSMKRDLALMLRAALAEKIPLVVNSCGGAGSEPHLQAVAELVREIAREDRSHFRLAIIHAEVPKREVEKFLAERRVTPLRNVPPLDVATIRSASRIVGMMGPEPFMRALDEGAQVVLSGRSTDPAPWAACAMRAGMPPAPSWYAGKMLECGSTPALPKGHDCLFVNVRKDHVITEPTNPSRRCTPFSVATHSLHENPSPVVHEEPGGILDTTRCRFEPVSERAVKVSGMTWERRPYSIKLEGATLVGHRAITICGTRDPVLISQIDDYLARARDDIESRAANFGVPRDEYRMIIHVYGKNGVMGGAEPLREIRSHELCLLIEVVADTQQKANSVLSIARVVIGKVDFPGRLCKSGNMAFPFSPSDIPVGPVYRFSVFHVVNGIDPYSLFPIEYESV